MTPKNKSAPPRLLLIAEGHISRFGVRYFAVFDPSFQSDIGMPGRSHVNLSRHLRLGQQIDGEIEPLLLRQKAVCGVRRETGKE